jgi:hypothetical protein
MPAAAAPAPPNIFFLSPSFQRFAALPVFSSSLVLYIPATSLFAVYQPIEQKPRACQGRNKEDHLQDVQ